MVRFHATLPCPMTKGYSAAHTGSAPAQAITVQAPSNHCAMPSVGRPLQGVMAQAPCVCSHPSWDPAGQMCLPPGGRPL